MSAGDATTPKDTPDSIAGFRIVRLLGEGASGRVYLAEQPEPRRQVALKVLTTVNAQNRRRFARETELLAGLEHPGIARLYAAGEDTVAGAPVFWFAMAYIDGRTLRDWQAQTRPDAARCMQLIAQLARTVHFAHTRGIVHRDLKPGNILVREDGSPCVVDFGIAHSMDDADGAAPMTHAGQVLGTLPYMALEQLMGQRVDPRTDVYALGVVAYELLSGQLPHPGLSDATLIDAVEQLRWARVSPPSAHHGGSDRDLDTIIGKAMAAEAPQRYGSAAEFAADIDRWLRHQPIEARRPTAAYVMGLFVRRHRALSAAAGIAVLALVVAAVVSVRFGLSERQARELAQARLEEREAVADLLGNMLSQADPYASQGIEVTVLDVVDRASARLVSDATVPPGVRARMLLTLGRTYTRLGRGGDAVDNLQRALDQTGTSREDQLDLRLALAEAQVRTGRESAAAATLDRLDAELARDTAQHDRRTTARTVRGRLLVQTGRFADAQAVLAPAYDAARQHLPADNPARLEAGIALANALQRQGKLTRAIALAAQLEHNAMAAHGPRHPLTLDVVKAHALALREDGQIEAALGKFRGVLDTLTDMLGPDHIDVAGAQIDVAATLSQAGRARDALPMARAAHQAIVARVGEDNDLARTITALRASVASYADEFDEAIPLFESLIAHHEQKTGGPTANDLIDYNNLATAYKLDGQINEALRCFEQLLDHGDRVLGAEHPHYGIFESNYGEALRVAGRDAQAIPHLQHALAVTRDTLGADHPTTQATADSLKLARAAVDGAS